MMTDLGFTYHPGTAGSSVRFDPPNPKDRVSVLLWLLYGSVLMNGWCRRRSVSTNVSYSVLRWSTAAEYVLIAHPNPTIHPKKLRDFSKKLQEYYGWDPEEFLKATQAAEDSD